MESSTPIRTWTKLLFSVSAIALGKGMNPSVLHRAIGKWYSRMDSLALVKQPEKKIKPCLFRLNIDLVSQPAHDMIII